MQLVQEPAAAPEYVPCPQARQELEPAMAYVPAAQLEQDVALGKVLMVPAAQGAHTRSVVVVPMALTSCPAVQSVQLGQTLSLVPPTLKVPLPQTPHVRLRIVEGVLVAC
jgi:hypothetical protein